MKRYYIPSRMVVAGVNVDHEDLVELTRKYFVESKPIWHKEGEVIKAPDESLTQYTGGIVKVTMIGKEKKLRCTYSVCKRVFSFLSQTFSSTCPLGKLERTESIACPEKCAEELCPKCLLVLWMSKHELTLVPQTK